jgi:hypothetical protein
MITTYNLISRTSVAKSKGTHTYLSARIPSHSVCTFKISSQYLNMNALPRYSDVQIAAHHYQKKVRFHDISPEVREIPAGMETWRNGDKADFTSEEDEANADTLWQDAYALATAQEEQEAADYFSTTHVQPSRKRLARPATPGLRALHHQVTETVSHAIHKPAHYRAHTTPAWVDWPLQGVSYRETSRQPRYERTLTNHSFNSFLDTKELGHSGEDMCERRASLHPFEHMATLAFRKVKKEGSKAVAFMEEKIREQQSKKR